MGFLDFFRPRWRHSNADVRAEAVRQLGADDLDLLRRVLREDPEARIRRIALKKIDDPETLERVAAEDADSALRKEAEEKAQAHLVQLALSDVDEGQAIAALERINTPKGRAEVAKRAAHESVRRAALARMSDPKAIAEVARKSDDPHIRRQAVEKITDLGVLKEVAISDGAREVALAALERIEDAATLELIVKKTKLKAVKVAAKEKAAAKRQAARPEDPTGMPESKRRAEQAFICRTLEEAASSDDWDHAEATVEMAKKQWALLGKVPGDEPFQKRFDRALARYTLRREEHQAMARALEAQRARAAEEQARKEAEEQARSQARAEEDAKLKEVADAARREGDERRAAERARRAEEKQRREAEKARREAEKEEKRRKREAEAAENATRLGEVTARLEALADTDDRKAAEAALKAAHEVAQSVGGNLPRDDKSARERYQAARDKLAIKVKELREAEDWRRWANVPRLEALCVKMEALLLEEDLKKATAELKALQAEWKTVGPAPKEKSEALWKRFKAAGDQVYERGKQQHAVDDETRQLNLKKKEELCVRVEALAETPDEQMNWKETAETIKALQEEWKGIGHAPKAEGDAVWKRFRAACDQFFERRKAHFGKLDEGRAENAKKLEALCDRAEALSATPDERINWKDTADQLKALQAEWKEVGPAPKEQSEALWKRFREACDRFFERRKAHFAELDEERAANLKKKELLCERAEALKDADDLEAAQAECKKLQAEWRSLGPAPKDQADAIWARFRAACDAVFDRDREVPVELPPEAAGAKFENKLPLAGIAEKLQAAASEWEALAEETPEEKAK